MSSKLIYGLNPIRLLCDREPDRIRQIWFAKTSHQPEDLWLKHHPEHAAIKACAEQFQIPVQWSKLTTFEAKLSDPESVRRHPVVHQSVMAEIVRTGCASVEFAKQRFQEYIQSPSSDAACILILDHITDPQNLGACLRVADATGVDLVITPARNSAVWSPVVCKASSGASEYVPWLSGVNLSQVLRQLKQAGFWAIGTSDHQGSQSLFDLEFNRRTVLLMGSEGRGLSPGLLELCDFKINIPMQGAVSSLNVSNAAAVCLYEYMRQTNL